jgi:hypothetical protein
MEKKTIIVSATVYFEVPAPHEPGVKEFLSIQAADILTQVINDDKLSGFIGLTSIKKIARLVRENAKVLKQPEVLKRLRTNQNSPKTEE